MRYTLTHRSFDADIPGRPDLDIDLDEDALPTAVAAAIRSFGHGRNDDEDEFLILTQSDNSPRPIGTRLVNAVQAAGHNGKLVLEFITEDSTGDPRAHRALRLARVETTSYDPANPDRFDRNAVACLLHCFVEQRDLSHLFHLVESWSAAEEADDHADGDLE